MVHLKPLFVVKSHAALVAQGCGANRAFLFLLKGSQPPRDSTGSAQPHSKFLSPGYSCQGNPTSSREAAGEGPYPDRVLAGPVCNQVPSGDQPHRLEHLILRAALGDWTKFVMPCGQASDLLAFTLTRLEILGSPDTRHYTQE